MVSKQLFKQLRFTVYVHNIDYIGSSSNRMNVHLLQHLTYHVKNWGPLWSFSCFSFESLNGELKKYYHGTRNMNDQVLQIKKRYPCYTHICTHTLSGTPVLSLDGKYTVYCSLILVLNIYAVLP